MWQNKIYIIEFVQTNRSKSIVIDYYSTWCCLLQCKQFQILWHTMHNLSNLFFSIFLSIFSISIYVYCVDKVRPKKATFSIANCYYLFATLLILWLCDTILFAFFLYLFIYCYFTNRNFIQWNLFFSKPFRAIHMCGSILKKKILRCVTL